MNIKYSAITRLLIALILLLAFPGCESGGGASVEPVGQETQNARGSISLTLNPAAIPRGILSQTTGTPDTLVIDVLSSGTRENVHPQTVFQFARTGSETFTLQDVQTGALIVKIQIFDSSGEIFFSGEEAAQLNPGQPVAVQFVIAGGGTVGTPSAAFRCVRNVDDEQGQPDVAMRNDGYFFVAGRVTDASVGGGSFSAYGFIHGERFSTIFDGNLPTRIDDANGNNGDFDLSQYSSLDDALGPALDDQFDQQAIFPRISMNSSGAAVVAWLDSNPSEAAGGANNTTRQSIIRSVIIGPDSNTTNNSSGHVEPELNPPTFANNAEPNVAGPDIGLRRPSVSMTDSISGNATIHYSFFGTPIFSNPAHLVEAADGGVSAMGVAPNSSPPVNFVDQDPVEFFDNQVDLVVANRPSDATIAAIAGKSISQANHVQLAVVPGPPGAVDVNIGEPSALRETTPGTDFVEAVEMDWLDSGAIVVVYSIFHNDVNGTGLYARYFNSNLTPITGEIEIASATGAFNYDPDVVVADADRTFLVTWTQRVGAVNNVMLDRFDTITGASMLTSPISVTGDLTATDTPGIVVGTNGFSRVSCTRDGDAVVVWQTGEAIPNTPNVKIFGRLYPRGTTGGTGLFPTL